MEEQLKIKKEKIKSIAIVFLVIMLFFTLFSNSIMNFSLVEVSTEAVTADSLTTKIRGTGTVKSEDDYAVTVDGDRKIEKMYVRVGDEVKTDDLLFTVEAKKFEEIDTMEDEIADAVAAYNKAVITSGITSAERYMVEGNNINSLTEMQDVLTEAEARVDYLKKQKRELEKSKTWTVNQYTIEMENSEGILYGSGLLNSSVWGGMTDINKAYGYYMANLEMQITETEEAIEDAQKVLDRIKKVYTSQLDLKDQLRKIADKRSDLKEKKDEVYKTEYKANVSGIVSNIEITAGKQAKEGDTVLTILPESSVYTISFDVKSQYASRIKPGDMVSILNSWSAKNISVNVKTVKRVQGSRDMVTVVCNIMGDVKEGEQYTLSIGQGSANYDHIVSTSSIREDSNGKYVLTIESKSTPLGNRYYARRTPIEIITSDDAKTAVSGTFADNAYVITTTSKPIKENEQVRLAD